MPSSRSCHAACSGVGRARGAPAGAAATAPGKVRSIARAAVQEANVGLVVIVKCAARPPVNRFRPGRAMTFFCCVRLRARRDRRRRHPFGEPSSAGCISPLSASTGISAGNFPHPDPRRGSGRGRLARPSAAVPCSDGAPPRQDDRRRPISIRGLGLPPKERLTAGNGRHAVSSAPAGRRTPGSGNVAEGYRHPAFRS